MLIPRVLYAFIIVIGSLTATATKSGAMVPAQVNPSPNVTTTTPPAVHGNGKCPTNPENPVPHCWRGTPPPEVLRLLLHSPPPSHKPAPSPKPSGRFQQ